MKSLFVILSGLPASGKSTLGRAIAKALRIPMLDKDEILEALFESRGIGDVDWRRRLSRIADQKLIEKSTRMPAAVITSWWRHPNSSAASGTPSEWLQSLQGEVVEIYCVCSPSVAVSRFIDRTRHAGHLDGRQTFESLLESFQTQASFGPLRIGRTIEVSTETEPSVARLVGLIGCDPTGNRCYAEPAA